MIKIKNYCIKNNIKIYYTDTDSIFIDKPLPSKMIGDGLGLLKDEMNGTLIQEGCFLGIKQYGYWYLDNNNHRIERSVYAGLERNSVKFDNLIF